MQKEDQCDDRYGFALAMAAGRELGPAYGCGEQRSQEFSLIH
jgi:hypothetical protein